MVIFGGHVSGERANAQHALRIAVVVCFIYLFIILVISLNYLNIYWTDLQQENCRICRTLDV